MMFRFNVTSLLLWSLHLLFAVVVVPSTRICGCVFTLLLRLIFKCARLVTCGKLEKKISEMETWENEE